MCVLMAHRDRRGVTVRILRFRGHRDHAGFRVRMGQIPQSRDRPARRGVMVRILRFRGHGVCRVEQVLTVRMVGTGGMVLILRFPAHKDHRDCPATMGKTPQCPDHAAHRGVTALTLRFRGRGAYKENAGLQGQILA